MLSRRELLVAGVAGSAAMVLPSLSPQVVQAASVEEEPFFALNTGTLMGFNLPLEKEIEVTAQAGYRGIEVWMLKIRQSLEKGTVAELKKHFTDSGVKLMSAISFPQWIVDDENERAKGVEQMKQEMEILAQLDCPHIAAPAAGATNRRIDDLDACGERYRTILEIGESIGVIPLLELWGASATLSRLSDCVTIAIASGHSKASLLLDAYHLYRGGNRFESLTQIAGSSLRVFHINDYPADPPRERLNDGHRIYPGDGICPLADVVQTLRQSGFRGAFSLELFNRSYWESGDPLGVAKTGLEKMKKALLGP